MGLVGSNMFHLQTRSTKQRIARGSPSLASPASAPTTRSQWQMASAALALLLPRGVPALRASSASLPRRCALGILAAVEPLSPPAAASAGEGAPASSAGGPKATPPLKALHGTPWKLHPDYRRWKDAEEEILRDIEPIRMLTKYILHSDRYIDGERLSAKDEKEVIGKLLRYHPRSEDKIGRGLDYIMVDRHPQFKHSRCLFVVRTDGGWIDFSYQKCLRAYIRDKYPLHAERFIGEHLKRN